MAKQDVSIIDKHIEKIVLGVCGLVFVGTVMYCFVLGRFAVNDAGADALVEQAAEKAEQIRDRALAASVKPDDPTTGGAQTTQSVEQLARWFGETAPGLIENAGIAPTTPRSYPFGPAFVSAVESDEGEERSLVKLVPPHIPVAAGGTSTFNMPTEKPPLSDYTGGENPTPTPSERPWVSVSTQVDLVEQETNFRAANYPPRSFLQIVRVHLQRKDLTEPWRRGWENVDTYLPFSEFEMPQVVEEAGGAMKWRGMDRGEFTRIIVQNQDAIARPRLPLVVRGDNWRAPPVPFLERPPESAQDTGTSRFTGVRTPATPKGGPDMTSRIRNWISTAKRALRGRRPFEDVDVDAAYINARSALVVAESANVDERLRRDVVETFEEAFKLAEQQGRPVSRPRNAADRQMPIMAHDLSAIPGHTYVYRIRYEVLNIFAANPGALADREDAGHVTLVSDWSPPSRPVEIPSETRIFVTGAERDRGQVTVTVYKKNRRGWASEEYKVAVGETIGRKERRGPNRGIDFSTGLVVVDIDFDRRSDGKDDVAMVYASVDGSRIGENLLLRDRSDPARRRLSQQLAANR